jgi:catechol 2,3-dioxygenase-like lactoylglutathione lyase family enzyme
MSTQTTAGLTGILTVAVPVSDQDRALDFYRGTLGLEVRRDATFGPGLRWVEVAPTGAQTTVALAPRGDAQHAGVETGIRLGTADAASSHAYLKSQHVDVDDILHMPGAPPMFVLRDVDGNTIVVVESAPA